jgi:hypothetical protein
MFVHTTLFHRSSFITFGLLLITLAVVVSGCGPTHHTYTYGNVHSLPASAMHTGDEFYTYRRRDQLLLKWTASPGPDSSESSPSSVKISVEMRGPFVSLSAMQAALGPEGTSGPIVQTMKPIQTDDWTNKTYQYNFSLQNLKPGYYVLIQIIDTPQALNVVRSGIKIES